MKSPDRFDFFAFQIGTQLQNIAVVAVEIMEMHDVGSQLFQLQDQLLCGQIGIEAIIAKDP